MIRANDAGDGASIPRARIRSWTLIGPWSRHERSSAARTATACRRTSSMIFVGLLLGRRERGSNTAAGPSAAARLRIS